MKELEELRKELTAIDQQILDLFRKRLAVVEKVADYKLKAGSPVYAPVWEGVNVAKARSGMPGGLEEYGAALARTLMRLSRERQYELILGEEPRWQLLRALREARDRESSLESLVAVKGAPEQAAREAFPQVRITAAPDAGTACASLAAGVVDGAVLTREAALDALAFEPLYIQASLVGDGTFLVLGRKLEASAGTGRAGLLVELAPEPAALALVAGVFADLDVQVVHLQTLDAASGRLCFVEFAAEALDRRALRSLYQLEQETAGLRFLGWYPVLELD